MTATFVPVSSWSVVRIRRALASESKGRRITEPGSAAFEWSTPAEAQTNPWLGLCDHEAASRSDDTSRLAEDHLELRQVRLGPGELACEIRRLDPFE